MRRIGFVGRFLSVGWIVVAAAAVVALCGAWVAGLKLNVIETSSMAPTLARNSLAVVAPVVPRSIRAGDVIAFVDRSRGGVRVMHRVERVIEQNGGRFFQTRGDANGVSDAWLVPVEDVTGRLVWRAGHLGRVVGLLAPPAGAIVLIGGPLVALVLAEVRRSRFIVKEAT